MDMDMDMPTQVRHIMVTDVCEMTNNTYKGQ